MVKYLLTLICCFLGHLLIAQAIELQPSSDGSQQLSLKSHNGLEFFTIRMDNDGVLRIRRNSSTDALVIDDETGNVGMSTEFSASSKLYVVEDSPTTTANPRYGIYSYVTVGGTGSRFGVYGNVDGNTGDRYGVYGRANSTESGHYGVYCNGNLHYTGSITAVSDARLKSNISELSGGLDLVMGLKPSKFQFRRDIKSIDLAEGIQMGFLAQDLEDILPELVVTSLYEGDPGIEPESTEKLEMKSINYIGLIPILTRAIQEQQKEIDFLKKQIEELKSSRNRDEMTHKW